MGQAYVREGRIIEVYINLAVLIRREEFLLMSELCILMFQNLKRIHRTILTLKSTKCEHSGLSIKISVLWVHHTLGQGIINTQNRKMKVKLYLTFTTWYYSPFMRTLFDNEQLTVNRAIQSLAFRRLIPLCSYIHFYQKDF